MTEEHFPPPQLPAQTDAGLAIASLVLGILGICLSPFVIGAVLGLVGLILGIRHLSKGRVYGRVMAGWGVGLSALGAVAGLMFVTVYTYFVVQFMPTVDLDEFMEGADFGAWEGVRAPELTVTTLDGNTVTLSSLRGKRVIVDIWATWCPPCIKEVPHFIQLASEIPPEELAIVGISDEDAETLKEFVAEKGVNYAIASASPLPSPYGDATSIPTTFFIDRNGVIQQVLTGYHDLEALRAAATAPDFSGTPLDAPQSPPHALADAAHPLAARERWTVPLDGAVALCTGDWNGDGTPEVLVSDRDPSLHVLDGNGGELAKISLPEAFSRIELGRHAGGPRLLGYDNWGKAVHVVDRTGATLWTYDSWMGINGAHWGDADGDGNDEMIVGMNGGGGLHLVSDTGEKIWKKSLGNVWNQAFVRTPGGLVRILATEAGGTIRIFDGAGDKVDILRPGGDYCTEVLAAVAGGGEAIRIISSGEGRAILCDADGEVLWSTPVPEDHASWRSGSFATGDVHGDGSPEWAFFGGDETLLLVSTEGERLAALPGLSGIEGFAFAGPNLIALGQNTLTAYGFEPAPAEADPVPAASETPVN